MSNIRDVAALAGVSPATVSRVINHDTVYKMTDETRERVWKAIAELNYKAHTSSAEQTKLVQKNLAAIKNEHRFGCILNVRGGKYSDPYYLAVLSGFEEVMMSKGYEIAFVHTNNELEDKQLLAKTFAEPIDGLIIMNTLEEETFSFINKRIPNIVGVDTKHSSIDNIGYNHHVSASMAVKHLYECGYRKIGFIGGVEKDINSCQRYKGYYATLHELGLEYNPDWVLASNWDENYCHSTITKAYKAGKLPEAYFVASDLMAIATLRAFYDLGISVPKDCAVMGLSNIEISKYSNPPLSTISIPIKDMGRVAAKVLLDRVNGDDTPIKTITLGLETIKRSST